MELKLAACGEERAQADVPTTHVHRAGRYQKDDAAAVAGLQCRKRPLLREYARRDRETERRPIQALRPPMRSCQRVAAEASSSWSFD